MSDITALRPGALAAILGATVLVLPLDAHAQRGQGAPNRAAVEGQALLQHVGGGIDALADSLSLDGDQRDRIAELVAEFNDANGDLVRSLAAMRRQMRRAMAARDRAAVAEARRRMSREHGNPAEELAPALAALRENIEAALDDSQRKRLAEMLSRAMRRRPGGAAPTSAYAATSVALPSPRISLSA